MSYPRTVVTRWTRRDWLAVAVIALTVTFVVGTAVTLLATSSQIEGEIQRLDALERAEYQAEAGGGAAAMPVAEVTVNGSATRLVAPPSGGVSLSSSFDEATIPGPPDDGVVVGGSAAAGSVEIVGSDAARTLPVRPGPRPAVLPERWYAADAETVRSVGRTGTLAVEGGADGGTGTVPTDGTLLLGAPAFVVVGGRALVDLLGLVALGSGVLVAVTVYSVTRMTVRDRRRTLFVVRASGGRRRRLVGLFAARAGLLTAVGGAFGYAFGVILVNLILNVATYFGQVTTLDTSGSPREWALIAGLVGALVVVGAAAGAVSAARSVASSPAALLRGSAGGRGVGSRLRAWLGLEVLDLRTAVPMTATLTVFVTLTVLTVSVGVTLAPLVGATDGLVMAPGAGYPIESEVPRELTASFRAAGVPASPEVVLPQLGGGEPYMLRGANYTAFATVSGTSLVEGRRPAAVDEAVVGADLAETLGVEIGEAVTVGGGTAYGLDRVRIVGRFTGPGFTDDQLVVPVATAQGLANLDAGTVQLIRTTGVVVLPENETAANETATATGTPGGGTLTTPAGTAGPGGGAGAAGPGGSGDGTGGGGAGNRSGAGTGDGTGTAVPGTAGPEGSGDGVGGGTGGGGIGTGGGNGTAAPGTARPGAPGTGDGNGTGSGDGGPGAPGAGTPVNDSTDRTATPQPGQLVVTDLSAPATALVNETVTVAVTVTNPGEGRASRELTVTYGDTSRTVPVTLDGGASRRVSVPVTFGTSGANEIAVANRRVTIRVLQPAVFEFGPLPDAGPPNATLLVTVRGGAPNAAVTMGNRSAAVAANGTARLRLPATPGTYDLALRVGDRTVRTRSFDVRADAGRRFVASITAEPATVRLPNDVAVTARLTNPWATGLQQNLTLMRDEEAVLRRPVTLPPGGSATVATTVQPVTAAGTQRVTAVLDGTAVASATYTVQASDRVVALLARQGLYTQGSSLMRSLVDLIGNLQVVQAILFALAFLMSVGSTATVVVQSVHAHRESVGLRRVTGATPAELVRSLLADGLKVGAVASLVAVGASYLALEAFVAAGFTVLFGVRIEPLVDPVLLGGVFVEALLLVVISVLVAAVWVLRVQPGDLLTTSTQRVPDASGSERGVVEADD